MGAHVSDATVSCAAPIRGTPCDGPARFEVVITLSNGTEHERHAACFRHGLDEVDRAVAAASMARHELRERAS